MTASGDFVQELTHCDGTQTTIVSGRTCSVPMTTIRTLTSLPRDSLIRVEVRAYNAHGTGQFSEVNTLGATVETEPTNLSVVSINIPATSNVATEVDWTALTGSARGGMNVLITDYEVYWDQSTGVWVSLANTTSLSTTVTGLTGGVTYAFEVRAYNKYGYGLFTSSVSIQTSQAPSQPTAPVLAVVGAYVKISWVAPFPNYSPVTGYQILIGTSTGSFVENKALCDGQAQAAVGYCLVDMHALRAAPFNLVYNELVQAEVLAVNARGWSVPSLPNTVGALVEVEPSAVVAPTRGSLTGPTQIEVQWISLVTPADGSSAVLSYHLQYDNGTASTTWYDVVGLSPDSLLTDVIVSSAIVSGTTYGFRVRALNIFGWGPFSVVTYIQAAREPDMPVAPVTSIDAATGGVTITWTAPSARGDPITAYKIEIVDATSTTWSTVSSCDGSSAAVVAALTCVVPMPTLTSSPFNYIFDQVVYVRVSAQNSYGYGVVSPDNANTGARIRSVPSQMAPPTLDILSTDVTVIIDWVALSGVQAGNSAVIAYSLYWDNAVDVTADIELVDALVTTFTVNGVTGGATYNFRLRARNIYGYGAYSNVLVVVPADAPGKTDIPTVALSTSDPTQV